MALVLGPATQTRGIWPPPKIFLGRFPSRGHSGGAGSVGRSGGAGTRGRSGGAGTRGRYGGAGT